MTAEFLEQAAQRILNDRHREAGLRDRIGLGQLAALALEGFEQNAARLDLGVRLGCKGGIGRHAPCHASHWRDRQEVLRPRWRLHGRRPRLYLLCWHLRSKILARKGIRWTRNSPWSCA